MHDTIRLLEKENIELRAQLNFAIDMMVLNHNCVFCPMSNECESNGSEEFDVIECTKQHTEFLKLVGEDECYGS